jgi:hypothetical protein
VQTPVLVTINHLPFAGALTEEGEVHQGGAAGAGEGEGAGAGCFFAPIFKKVSNLIQEPKKKPEESVIQEREQGQRQEQV